jgi:putative transposase
MSRPLRIEFAGGLYYVTSRGDGREAIFLGKEDRRLFLGVLAEVVPDFNCAVHAYCLMDNHYHLLIETPDGNLSKGVRQVNAGKLRFKCWKNRGVGPGRKDASPRVSV